LEGIGQGCGRAARILEKTAREWQIK
jgi:hypothetical protein